MTQNANDVEIANQGFAAFRQDLNDVLEDIATLHSGDDAPSTTYANQFWYETDTDKLYIRNEDNDAWIEILTLDQANDHLATIGASITLDGTGNVGIGTEPSESLHIADGGKLRLERPDGATYSNISMQAGGAGGLNFFNNNNDGFEFEYATGGVQMIIDSSGNLLIGKTARDAQDAGVELLGIGASVHSYGGEVIKANRLTSDGPIISFAKDNTTVGKIATIASTMYLYTGNVGLRFGASNDVRPCFSTGLNRDNAIDLGTSSARFDDIYATNGTIQTSDQNEKQQIASLTAAEITAAKAISKLFKTFKWNDSVTENGDNARTHTGVIAQDVQQALTDASLDASDYAFFISNTWWETSTDVAAVAAAAEVLDSDGNVVTEAVEAVDAYTRVETYDTQADAPAGATQRTRLGIRYPELLAFVGAATEQRLADIETRLTALEAV